MFLKDCKGVSRTGSEKLVVLVGERVVGCNNGDGEDGGGIVEKEAQDGPFMNPSECFGVADGFSGASFRGGSGCLFKVSAPAVRLYSMRCDSLETFN